MKPPFASWPLTLALAGALVSGNVQAQSSSALSEASLLPVAVSVALPVMLVAGVGSLVVTGVQASAEGVVWLVENVADGVKVSICFAGHVVAVAGIAVGTVIVATVVGTGVVLSAAGRAIAF